MSPRHPGDPLRHQHRDRPARRRRLGHALLALAGVLVGPAAAQALSLAPATVPLDSLLTAGTFQFLGAQSGLPAGAVVGFGSVAPGDVTLLFSFSVDADADGAALVAGLGGPAGQPWKAAGHVPGPGTAPHSVIDTGQGVGFGIGILPGQSTTALFVSAASIAPGTELEVALGYSTATLATGTVTVVPEPGGALLIGVGMVWLAAHRGRRPAPP